MTQTIYEVMDFLIIADDWQNANPKLYWPDGNAVLDDDGTLYVRFAEPSKMSVGSVMPLQYQWEIPDLVFEDFYVEEKKPIWPWFTVGGGGIISGLIIGLLLSK